ncbi:DUF1302 domain-containing protein [Pseudomonas alabamensis]|uniref:DUF1302 domain-containing protein n=1 Tax=Pseudomonas alabamensis TaxID=3064349 RepID=UPI000745EF49|nr:adhesin [Pseudomonas monteilii]
MTSARACWRRARLPLAISLASSLAPPAFGVSFNIGEVEAQLDTTLSIGAGWSTAKPDKGLIGANNGGRGLAPISDDGRQNFKRGETFSKVFTGLHGLELKYGDSGVYLRGRYWYDFELKDEGRPFKDIDDSHRARSARSSGGELLEAFAYHHYTLGAQPGTVRLGRQVVNWGEGLFIGGGINAINRTDVSAFRRPGTALKDGQAPVNLFYVSQQLTDAVSAEAFYQLEWAQTDGENCGTFFSQSDVLGNGCTDNLRLLDSRRTVSAADQALLAGQGVAMDDEGVKVGRGVDRDARDGGQFGLALHYRFEPLDTEFGAYVMNYHSRLPFLNARGASASALAASQTLPEALRPLALGGNSRYAVAYPEDIRLYGVSFATTLPTGMAWRGELSYRPNAPVQLNTHDVLYASLRPAGGAWAEASLLDGAVGEAIPGYRRKDVTQFQTSLTQVFDQLMGARRFTVMGELGMTYVGGLDSTHQARYGRDAVFGPGPLPQADGGNGCARLNASTYAGSGLGNGADPGRHCENDGYTTRLAWGYRARAAWEYDNVFAGVDLTPSIAWSHDVSGYSPGPQSTFEEGRKAVSLGLDAEYQNTYMASVAYTNFFGGAYSTMSDRDFLTLSVGVKF